MTVLDYLLVLLYIATSFNKTGIEPMKQVFQASDGTQFDTEDEAVRYESVAGKKGAITNWAEACYGNKRLTKKHTNVVLQWEADRDAALAAI